MKTSNIEVLTTTGAACWLDSRSSLCIDLDLDLTCLLIFHPESRISVFGKCILKARYTTSKA